MWYFWIGLLYQNTLKEVIKTIQFGKCFRMILPSSISDPSSDPNVLSGGHQAWWEVILTTGSFHQYGQCKVGGEIGSIIDHVYTSSALSDMIHMPKRACSARVHTFISKANCAATTRVPPMLWMKQDPSPLQSLPNLSEVHLGSPSQAAHPAEFINQNLRVASSDRAIITSIQWMNEPIFNYVSRIFKNLINKQPHAHGNVNSSQVIP